jgi:hypothetical protein
LDIVELEIRFDIKGHESLSSTVDSGTRWSSSTRHIPGWRAGNTGSKLYPPAYQKLAGPWTGGIDPAAEASTGTTGYVVAQASHAIP